jgi:DNA-binding MarR family transcriptional regulator
MTLHREIFLMEQIYATLFSLANKLQTTGDRYLGELTSRQLMAMIAIAHLPAHDSTLNNIARRLGTTKQSVKQVVSSIEKKGYVTTVPHQTDKRAVNVKITASGTRAILDGGQRGMKLFKMLFKEFSLGEMETLWTLLMKLFRFDGQMQNGFEEETAIGTPAQQAAVNKKIKKLFPKRRSQGAQNK